MNTVRGILFIAILGLHPSGHAAEAGKDAETKGRVLEFGAFESTGPQQKITNPNTLDGNEQNSTGARFIERTAHIPAKSGIQFGFRYKITGVTEKDSADFNVVVTHPPIKNSKGEVEQQYSTPETLPVRDHCVSEVSGYSLDRPEELVPGVWTFELWYHGRKLVAKSFTVYMPDQYSKPPSKAQLKGSTVVSVWDLGQTIKLDNNATTVTVKNNKYIIVGVGGYPLGTQIEIQGKLRGPGLLLDVSAINGKQLNPHETVMLDGDYKQFGEYGSDCTLVGYETIFMAKDIPNLPMIAAPLPRDFATFGASFIILANKTPQTPPSK